MRKVLVGILLAVNSFALLAKPLMKRFWQRYQRQIEHLLRATRCVHFSGEVGGFADERDQWLTEQLSTLRCRHIRAELIAV